MFDISTEPLLFDLYYGGKSAVEISDEGIQTPKAAVLPAVDKTTPVFKNIYIKDVVCSGAKRAMFFNGLPEKNIENINIENITVHANKGGEIVESENIRLKNVKITTEQGPALILKNVKNVNVDGFTGNENQVTVYDISGANSKNIAIKSSYGKEKLKTGKEVKNTVVKLSKVN